MSIGWDEPRAEVPCCRSSSWFDYNEPALAVAPQWTSTWVRGCKHLSNHNLKAWLALLTCNQCYDWSVWSLSFVWQNSLNRDRWRVQGVVRFSRPHYTAAHFTVWLSVPYWYHFILRCSTAEGVAVIPTDLKYRRYPNHQRLQWIFVLSL